MAMERSDGRNGGAGPTIGRGKVGHIAKSGRLGSATTIESASRSFAGIRVSRDAAQSALRQGVYGHATGAALCAVRSREGAELVGCVKDWADGLDEANRRPRAQPIPALCGRAAEAMVMSGQAAFVREYLDHLSQGGRA